MIRLEYRGGSSNKFYELHLEEADGRVTVTGYYGAIGRAPKAHFIYDGTSREVADRMLEKKKTEKVNKGYVEVVTGM